MRPLTNPTVLVACILACGGWVCQSNADNRCPGAVTCDVDVANACCPFGSTAWCDSCVTDAKDCTSEVRTCTDLARVLDCSFEAKITTTQCLSRASISGGTETWTIKASGSMTGCGEEVAFVAFDDKHVDASCGAWSEGVFGGCIPPDDAISTTSWSTTTSVEHETSNPLPIEVTVVRGHANVELARAAVTCAP